MILMIEQDDVRQGRLHLFLVLWVSLSLVPLEQKVTIRNFL